ncbi:hypothetical protein HDU96_008799 [Phlyctochytrium bullatum]|nr:hypothetical protein HDU96_008799 [Phlyctochytrium bullatum]
MASHTSRLLLVLLVALIALHVDAQVATHEHQITVYKHNEARAAVGSKSLGWDFELAEQADREARQRSIDDLCGEDKKRAEKDLEDANLLRKGTRLNVHYKKTYDNPMMSGQDYLNAAVEVWIEGKDAKGKDYSKEKKRLSAARESAVGCSNRSSKHNQYFCSVTVCIYKSKAKAGNANAKKSKDATSHSSSDL